jgi:serine/threonine protein kinase
MSLIKLTPENLDSLYQIRLERKLQQQTIKNNKKSTTASYEQFKNEVVKDNEKSKFYNFDADEDYYKFVNNYRLESLDFEEDLTEQTINDIDIERIIINSDVKDSHGDAPCSRPGSAVVKRPKTASDVTITDTNKDSNNTNNKQENSVFNRLSKVTRAQSAPIKSKKIKSKEEIFNKCVLGRGKYSTVIKCRHTIVNASVAVKVIPTNSFINGKLRLQLAHNEAILLSRLRHTNIARLYQSFRIEWEPITNGPAALLVTELCDLGTLENFCLNNNLEISTIRNLVCQLIAAVSHIHGRDVIHRNICPKNILLKSNNANDFDKQAVIIKLIGFDTAILSKSKQFLPPLDSKPYNSPPELEKNVHLNNESLDIWSIGCVTNFLLFKKPPTEMSFDNFINYQQITNGNNNNSEINNNTTDFCQKFIELKTIHWPRLIQKKFENELLLTSTHKILQNIHEYEKQAIKNETKIINDFLKITLKPNPKNRAHIYELETSDWIKFVDYKPIKRQINSILKKEYFKVLGQVLNINPKSLSKRCHEQRFDELSAMYNLLLDNTNINTYIMSNNIQQQHTINNTEKVNNISNTIWGSTHQINDDLNKKRPHTGQIWNTNFKVDYQEKNNKINDEWNNESITNNPGRNSPINFQTDSNNIRAKSAQARLTNNTCNINQQMAYNIPTKKHNNNNIHVAAQLYQNDRDSIEKSHTSLKSIPERPIPNPEVKVHTIKLDNKYEKNAIYTNHEIKKNGFKVIKSAGSGGKKKIVGNTMSLGINMVNLKARPVQPSTKSLTHHKDRFAPKPLLGTRSNLNITQKQENELRKKTKFLNTIRLEPSKSVSNNKQSECNNPLVKTTCSKSKMKNRDSLKIGNINMVKSIGLNREKEKNGMLLKNSSMNKTTNVNHNNNNTCTVSCSINQQRGDYLQNTTSEIISQKLSNINSATIEKSSRMPIVPTLVSLDKNIPGKKWIAEDTKKQCNKRKISSGRGKVKSDIIFPRGVDGSNLMKKTAQDYMEIVNKNRRPKSTSQKTFGRAVTINRPMSVQIDYNYSRIKPGF